MRFFDDVTCDMTVDVTHPFDALLAPNWPAIGAALHAVVLCVRSLHLWRERVL